LQRISAVELTTRYQYTGTEFVKAQMQAEAPQLPVDEPDKADTQPLAEPTIAPVGPKETPQEGTAASE
jgi:hypothetical protein